MERVGLVVDDDGSEVIAQEVVVRELFFRICLFLEPVRDGRCGGGLFPELSEGRDVSSLDEIFAELL